MFTFNAQTQNLEIPLETLRRVSGELVYTLRSIREIAGKPMGKYKREGPLEPVDHAQRAVIDLAKAIGINLGADWGDQIDLRTKDELDTENDERSGGTSADVTGSANNL